MIIEKGDKFNRLTSIKFGYKDERSNQYWIFKCDCGIEKSIRVSNVKNGMVKSCGCLHKEIIKNVKSNLKHGMSRTKAYKSWASMKSRCFDKNNSSYKNYGSRGIKICKEWLKFENFYNDMGDRPENKSLDRIKNNKGYYKENCRWATRKEQQNNTRYNYLIEYNGKVQNMKQWAEELNINYSTIQNRIKRGWSIKKTFIN